MGRFSVDEVVLAWHRLRRQWRLHRTLYEYLGKVRAKLPDKHQWAEVISRGPDPPADSSRGADAPVSHSELERLMQVVLQDTTPDDVFSVSCLRTNWKNRRGDVFKGKLADKLGKAFQKLLDGALLAKTEKPEKITRDSTMYSTFQGFLRCKLRLVDLPNFNTQLTQPMGFRAYHDAQCRDWDTIYLTNATHEFQEFYRAHYWSAVLWSELGETANCSEMAQFCSSYDGRLVRNVCPRSCGCPSQYAQPWMMVNAEGCPTGCETELTLSMRRNPCVDRELSEMKTDWDFFWDNYVPYINLKLQTIRAGILGTPLSKIEEVASVSEDVGEVVDLKRRLRKMHGFPVCLQQLVCDGSCLKDDDRVKAPAELQLVLVAVSRKSDKAQLRKVEAELAEVAGSDIEVLRGMLQVRAGKLRRFCGAALQYAASCGSTEAVRLLLDAGTWPSCMALMLAASKGHTEVASLLIDAGAEKEMINSEGRTALILAAYHGHAGVVRLLVGAGANKNSQDIRERTALMWAVIYGHTEAVKHLLLDAGTDKDLQDCCSMTALLHAAKGGRTGIARLLVEAGADTSLPEYSGKTALIMAAYRGFDEIVRLLIDAGVDKDVFDDYDDEAIDRTALMWAASLGRIQIARSLVNAGANRHLRDKKGRTAVMWAARRGHNEVERLLTDAGAGKSLQDTVLSWAEIIFPTCLRWVRRSR
ncbi:unnamed protein product [Symbiodinium microadriaticum]|nr:unnamed protein product [Symbiodinium microadriaticum]